MELQWHTKTVRVGDLKGLPNNPRKISETERNKLMRSLEKWNVVEIPVCNIDLTVISGNQRVSALVLLGREFEEIDVRVPDRKLKKSEVKELALIGNTHNGEWVFDLLKEHYVELGDLGEFGIAMPVDIPPMDTTGLGEKDPFDDGGITATDQYGVIVMCADAIDQEKIFNSLTGQGYACKIVVT